MTLRSHASHRPAVHGPLTELNLRLSRAYFACEMTGGHLDSGARVTRHFPSGQRDLPICKRCGCPYGAPIHYWSSAKGGKA